MEGVRYATSEYDSLVKAVYGGRIEKVKEIISSRCLCYSEEWLNESAGYALLCIAVKLKDTEIVKLLLMNGSKVNSENEYPSGTPLHFAVENGDIEIVQMLLHKGANIDTKNSSGDTPLHIAIVLKKIEIIGILLNEGASFEDTNGNNVAPLHLAVGNGSEEIIKLLLKKGVNVNAEGKYGTSLRLATWMGQLKMVEFLLKCGANVNAMYISVHEMIYHETSLHLASRMGQLKIVEHLLKCGANVNAVHSSKNEELYTPLHLAAEFGHLDIIELLLKFGASVNSTDRYGLTALHIASKNGYEEVVTALLEHGSDITIMSKETDTAFDFAICPHKELWGDSNHGHVNVVKILKRHMVKIKAANLYAVNKDQLSISSPRFGSDDEELSDFQKECEKEIASMKSEVINDNITFYDILTGSVRQVAMYATSESIVEVFGSDNYKIKFPIYASMTKRNFRKGEKEKEFMEKGDKIFDFLFSKNLPLLPRDCTEKILSYLNYEDLI